MADVLVRNPSNNTGTIEGVLGEPKVVPTASLIIFPVVTGVPEDVIEFGREISHVNGVYQAPSAPADSDLLPTFMLSPCVRGNRLLPVQFWLYKVLVVHRGCTGFCLYVVYPRVSGEPATYACAGS